MRWYQSPYQSQDTRCLLLCFYPQALLQAEIRSIWHYLLLANQHWLFLFSWLFPRCRWLVRLIICSSAFPGTEIELTGYNCLAALISSFCSWAGSCSARGPALEEPRSPMLLPRAPAGSPTGPAPARGTAAVLADRCCPQPSSDHQSVARILPWAPSCPVLVMSLFHIFLEFIPCYMCRPLMPTLSHLHVSQFSVCFLLPCEAPEDWLF